MSDFLLFLALTVLLTPLFYLFAVVWWCFLFAVLSVLCARLFPPAPPYCDIDPRCHPAFAWAPDGSGWIGPIRVIPPQ